MTACAGAPGAESASAIGVVIAVNGPNAAQVDRFTLRTADGVTIEFEVGRLDVSYGGLPAPHLREHLVSGEVITVEYQVKGGGNVAVRYTDAQ